MIGVAVGALVGLRSIVSLIQALVAAGNGDPVVGSEEPGLLLRARVGLPDLGVHVVALRYSSVESEIGTGHNDGARTRRDVPSGSGLAVPSDEADAVGGLYTRRQG